MKATMILYLMRVFDAYLGLVVVHASCVLVHDHKVKLEQGGRQLKLSLPPLLTSWGRG
jgi:hypothetical protein